MPTAPQAPPRRRGGGREMSGSGSKSKSKSKQITIQKGELKELEQLKNLQKIVVIRYSVWLGKKLLLSQKMQKTKSELQRLRRVKKEIGELFKKAEETGKLDINKLRNLRKQYNSILEVYKEKTEPYNIKIRQLNKQIRYLDTLIVNNPTVKPNLKTITEVEQIPEELRVPQGGK